MFDYFYWKKFFLLEEIKKLNGICDLNKEKSFEDVAAYSTNNEKLKNLDNVDCVQWEHVKSFLQKAINQIEITNQINFGYSIYSFNDLDSVLFNTYKENDFYDWHKDQSNNQFHDVKFTIIINNSLQEYKGGGLEIFSHGGKTPIKEFEEPGSLLMFKSDIPHRVLPIEKGVRNSIVFL